MAECGYEAVVFREKVSEEGEVTLEWRGNLPCPVEWVLQRLSSGWLSQGRYAAEMIMEADGNWKPSDRVVLSSAEGVDQMLVDLVGAGLHPAMMSNWSTAIKSRRAAIIAKAVCEFRREENPDVSELEWSQIVGGIKKVRAEVVGSGDEEIPF